jgi:hypothetical protein
MFMLAATSTCVDDRDSDLSDQITEIFVCEACGNIYVCNRVIIKCSKALMKCGKAKTWRCCALHLLA